MFNASKAVRLLFLEIATFSMIGLWLTGFEHVHWFAYAVPAFMAFAGLTGFCPGLLVSNRLLKAIGVND